MVAPAGNAGRNSQRCQPGRPLQMTDDRWPAPIVLSSFFLSSIGHFGESVIHRRRGRSIITPFSPHAPFRFPGPSDQFVIWSFVICNAKPRRLDFPSPNASFLGFDAPVAQLDRVYDFGS